MDKMEKLQAILYERLHRRPPGIDKLDRLWEAAVLLPMCKPRRALPCFLKNGRTVCGVSQGRFAFPGARWNAVMHTILL